MKNYIITRILRAAFACLLLSQTAHAQNQTLAILDQGYNNKFVYKAKNKFYVQHCFSWADKFVGVVNPFQNVTSANYTTMNVSLCSNGQPFEPLATSQRHILVILTTQ